MPENSRNSVRDPMAYAGRTGSRTCLVVGAGALGVAIARRMAQHYRIVLADLDGAKAEATATAFRSEGFDAIGVACDITAPRDVDRIAQIVGSRGDFGALVQVAGLSPSLGDFATIMRVNLMGAALMAQAVLPHVTPGTAAILIASLAAHTGPLDQKALDIIRDAAAPDIAERLAAYLGENATPAMAYVHSKQGLLLYARRHASAWGAQGSRIVTVSPGMIATPQGALEFRNSPGKRRMFEATPLKRECSMQEIADAVEFLASDKASFITGTDLLVDGGISAALRQE